jgi:hypothetical protein
MEKGSILVNIAGMLLSRAGSSTIKLFYFNGGITSERPGAMKYPRIELKGRRQVF